MGKHQKAIRTGDFNSDGQMFGLGSDDQTITLNNTENGDTLKTFSCNGEIDCFQFTRFRRMDMRASSGTGEKGDKAEDFVTIFVANTFSVKIEIALSLDKCDSGAQKSDDCTYERARESHQPPVSRALREHSSNQLVIHCSL
jgi:hypothetical protein